MAAAKSTAVHICVSAVKSRSTLTFSFWINIKGKICRILFLIAATKSSSWCLRHSNSRGGQWVLWFFLETFAVPNWEKTLTQVGILITNGAVDITQHYIIIKWSRRLQWNNVEIKRNPSNVHFQWGEKNFQNQLQHGIFSSIFNTVL